MPNAKRKQLTRTLYDAPYHRAWQRQQTRRRQRMRGVRPGTVEPVFCNLLPYQGLRRMNVRALAGAHKTMLLTAVAHNLKKRLKYRPSQQVSVAGALLRLLLAANCCAGQQSRRFKVQNPALGLSR